MPAKGRGRHPLRSTWLGRGRGRGRGRGLTSPVGKQILPSGAARVGHEVYSDWFFPETELKLYLRNTTTNGISIGGVACYDLLTTAGASADTAVVNTTASGAEIQLTKTAGGSVAAFISGRVPSGGWTITASNVALWLKESASTVNAGLRFRLFKYSGGTETELGGSPFDAGTEFNTGSTLTTLVGNVTDTALAEDDRLLLRVYAVNIGTMGAGTATLGFNGAVGGTTGQITAYPDPANGNPRFAFGTSTSWAACRSNATSDPVEYPSNEVVFQGELVGAIYVISRIGYVFDTSSIPDNATITSATFSVYSTTTGDGSETTNPANGALVEYTPSSDTAPTTSDYQQFGTTRLADADVTRASFVASSAYKDWVLNATGLAAINKTGNTRLGIRPSNDFSDATAPTARSYAMGDFAAQTGTSQDPKLVIDYTTASSADSYINVYPTVTFKAESGGTIYNSSLSGALSFAGATSKRSNKALAGALPFTGSIGKAVARAFTATSGFVGSIAKQTSRQLSGALSFSGALNASHLFMVTFTAALAFSGSVAKKTSKTLGGALSFSGAIARQTRHSLTAALGFSGSLSRRTSRALAGALQFTGSAIKQTRRAFAASLGFSGSISRFISKAMTADLNFSGTIARQTRRSLTAALGFAGGLQKRVNKGLAGALSFSGAITRKVNMALAATLSFIGSLATQFSGAGGTLFTIAFTASLNLSGAVNKRTSRALEAALSFAGNISKRAGKTFTAMLDLSAQFSKQVNKGLTATLSFIGSLAAFIIAIGQRFGRRSVGSNADENSRDAAAENVRASAQDTGRPAGISSGRRANIQTKRRK